MNIQLLVTTLNHYRILPKQRTLHIKFLFPTKIYKQCRTTATKCTNMQFSIVEIIIYRADKLFSGTTKQIGFGMNSSPQSGCRRTSWHIPSTVFRACLRKAPARLLMSSRVISSRYWQLPRKDSQFFHSLHF